MKRKGILHRRVEFIVWGSLITFASWAVPYWLLYTVFQHHDDAIEIRLGWNNWCMIWSLVFSVLLIAPNPAYYGIRIGEIRDKWKWVLLICLVPILLTWIVYPRLPSQSFSGFGLWWWFTSPLAQDLLFAGYLYTKASEVFEGVLHEKLPLNTCIFVVAALFSLWHTPNFFHPEWNRWGLLCRHHPPVDGKHDLHRRGTHGGELHRHRLLIAVSRRAD